MENESSSWMPLAVMLSMFGGKISSKLLFKYPFEVGKKSQTSLMQSYRKLTSSTFHLNQANTSSDKGNDLSTENDDNDDAIKDETEQYLSFSDDTLAQISCPGNPSICGQKFDVKINGLRFVGFPLMLEHNNVESDLLHLGSFSAKTEASSSLSTSATDIFVRSFNVVFVLKTTANYSTVESYQQLAAKIGVGLRYEEKRDRYVTKQTKYMLNIHDEDTISCSEEISTGTGIYKKILKKSSLAQNLHHLYESLEKSGYINLTLNKNLSITFCLYHIVHNVCLENCEPLDIATIESCLSKVQPYHGLLVYDKQDVWDSLAESCSGSIIRFLNVYKPTKSLQALSTDADIALNHVFAIARHLVMWGKACIIYPLCETNLYVLAPSASLYYHSKYVGIFADRFELSLTNVLAYFSSPVRLGDYQSPTGPFFGNQNKLVEILIWMLQHRFLVQHHTYVYFMPPQNNPDVIRNLLLDALKKSNGETVQLKELPENCVKILSMVDASHIPEDLTLFLKVLKYFNGEHHLEEIMYCENLVRFQLITVLDKFQPFLLTCVREDPIAAAFCISK